MNQYYSDDHCIINYAGIRSVLKGSHLKQHPLVVTYKADTIYVVYENEEARNAAFNTIRAELDSRNKRKIVNQTESANGDIS